MIARRTVHGVTALTWTIMNDIAVKAEGDRFWMTRRKTASMVRELRGGGPVALSTISRAWATLQELNLIHPAGVDERSGATIWKLNPEPALRAYAEWRDIYDRHKAEGGSSSGRYGGSSACPLRG